MPTSNCPVSVDPTSPAASPAAPDPELAAAVEVARAAAVEEAGGEPIGAHVGVLPEDGAATHLFEAAVPGYRGWRWAVTVANAGTDTPVTVSEVVLLPGPDALTAPNWVPWQYRVQAGDLGVGDLLPTDPDDVRLVPAYLASDDDAVEAEATELGLGRVRVMSRIGRYEAVDRWLASDFGPDSDMARGAPGHCGTCGFFLPVAGSLRAAFGVCGNEFAPGDGHVVHVEYGCGAHSEVELDSSSLIPVSELVYDDTTLDVEPSERARPVAVAEVVAEPTVEVAAEPVAEAEPVADSVDTAAVEAETVEENPAVEETTETTEVAETAVDTEIAEEPAALEVAALEVAALEVVQADEAPVAEDIPAADEVLPVEPVSATAEALIGEPETESAPAEAAEPEVAEVPDSAEAEVVEPEVGHLEEADLEVAEPEAADRDIAETETEIADAPLADTAATEVVETQPAEPEPAETEQAQAETDQAAPAEAAQMEPVEVEPVQTDTAETETAETEAAQTKLVEVEPVQAEVAHTEPTQTEAAQTESAQIEAARVESVETELAETEPLETEAPAADIEPVTGQADESATEPSPEF